MKIFKVVVVLLIITAVACAGFAVCSKVKENEKQEVAVLI